MNELYRQFSPNNNAIKCVVLLCLSIVLLIGLIFAASIEDEQTVLFVSATITLVHLVVSFVFLNSFSIFSLPKLFFLLLYFFNFGELWLYGILDPQYPYFSHILFYPKDVYMVAIILAFAILSGLCVGILSWTPNESVKQVLFSKVYDDLELQKKAYKKIGLTILTICLPFQIYIYYKEISAALLMGYSGALTSGAYDSGIVFALGSLSIIGFSLIILTSKNKLCVLILSCAFFLFSMLSGDRDIATVKILLLVFVYTASVQSVKIQKNSLVKGALILVFMYLGLLFLKSVETMRNYDSVSIPLLFEAMGKTIDNGVLKAVLYEFGGSIYTSIVTVDYLNSTDLFGYGKTILLAPLVILPNGIFGIDSFIKENLNYGMIVQAYGITGFWSNIGGSFVGELIYNFWFLSPFVAFVFGRVFVYIDRTLVDKIKKNDFYAAAFFFTIYEGLIFWVRAYFYNGIRQILFGAILLFLLKNLYFRKKEKIICCKSD